MNDVIKSDRNKWINQTIIIIYYNLYIIIFLPFYKTKKFNKKYYKNEMNITNNIKIKKL